MEIKNQKEIDQTGYTPEMVKEINLIIEKLKDQKAKEYLIKKGGSV
jgi:hypothetical protein